MNLRTKQMFSVIAVLLAIAGAAVGQIRSGTIVGSVTDNSDAVVPNATVVVREQATNATYKVETNAAGQYTVPYLPVGRYTVSIQAAGFRPFSLTDI